MNRKHTVVVDGETVELEKQGRNSTHEFWTGKTSDGRIVLWTIGEGAENEDGDYEFVTRTKAYPIGQGPTYLGHD